MAQKTNYACVKGSKAAMLWHLDITGAYNSPVYPLRLNAEMNLQLKCYSLNREKNVTVVKSFQFAKPVPCHSCDFSAVDGPP